MRYYDALPDPVSESDILWTQITLFRQFMKRHSMDKWTACRLFEENGVFDYISDCYDILQYYGDAGALNDIDTILKHNGVRVE